MRAPNGHTVRAFLAARCVIANTCDVDPATLWAAWHDWCWSTRSCIAGRSTELPKRLRGIVPGLVISASNDRIYGLRLKTPGEIDSQREGE